MDENLICHQCLNEAYLIELIRRTGVTAECSFCLKSLKAIPFEDLISMVDDVLQKYCHPGAIYDQYDDNGKRSETEQTGDPLVFHVAELLGLNEDGPVVERVLCDLNEGSLSTPSACFHPFLLHHRHIWTARDDAHELGSFASEQV